MPSFHNPMQTQSPEHEDVTQELKFEAPRAKLVSDRGSLMAIDVAATSHAGHVRTNNEDHYLVVRFGRSLESIQTNVKPEILRPNYNLTGYALLVADGLGGMAGGEVASRTALAKIVNLVIDTPDWILGFEDNAKVDTIMSRMTERFLKVDETLKDQADHDASLSGMGTTLTTAATLNDDMVIGHIGDSRAYLFRNNALTQLTRDHTVAQELIDAGIDRADPATQSMRHVLTAALGSLGSRIQPEVQRIHLQEHDQILLCTDGLTEMVDDKTIASLLRNTSAAAKACEDLTTIALAAGGSDNITVVLARFGSTESKHPIAVN
jgi:serine/threonine protein phosphatase PrpC